MPPLSLSVVTRYKLLSSSSATPLSTIIETSAKISKSTDIKKSLDVEKDTIIKKAFITTLWIVLLGSTHHAYADSMSTLIAQKSSQTQLAVPKAKISTRSTIQRAQTSQRPQASYASSANPLYTSIPPSLNTYNSYSTNTSIRNNNNTQRTTTAYNYQLPTSAPAINVTYRNPSSNYPSNHYPAYRYPENTRQSPSVLPAFLSGNYDNVDREYLPLLSRAEVQSNQAAREVISMARKMALNERTIIQGGCWDYLDAVFKRAGVTRDTVHKGEYGQGPYAHSNEIEIGDWLYYINHGYNGVEHSGLFVGWVDESAKQALMLSYAGESRREPARYRVYDLSNVYQIMRPTI